MEAQLACDQILSSRGLRNGIAVRVGGNKLAARDQLLQPSRQFLPLIAVKSQFTHELLVPRSLLGLALDLFQNDGIGEHENQLLAPKLLAASKTLSPPSTRSPRENVFQFSSLRTRRPVRFKAFKLKDIRIRRFLRLCPQALPGNPRQNPEMHKVFLFSTIHWHRWRVEFLWPPKREFGPQTIFPLGKDFFSHVEAY